MGVIVLSGLAWGDLLVDGLDVDGLDVDRLVLGWIDALTLWGIEGWLDPWLGLWALLFVSCVANLDFHRRFQASIRSAPQLEPLDSWSCWMICLGICRA